MIKLLSNLSLGSKTTVFLAATLSILLIGMNIFTASYTHDIINNKVNSQLEQRLDEIYTTLEIYDNLIQDTASDLHKAFKSQFNNFEIDESTQFTTTLVIINLFAIILILYVIKKIIKDPILKFQNGLIEFFSYLNNEKDNTYEIDINTNDEIGAMSKLVNKNIEQIK